MSHRKMSYAYLEVCLPSFFLFQAGADVKGVGTVTPLITAVNNGLTDFYNCLLEAGADPDVRDDVSFLLFNFLHVFSHHGMAFYAWEIM